MCRIGFLILVMAFTAPLGQLAKRPGPFRRSQRFRRSRPALHLRSRPSRYPTYLRAISLVAAVGVASAIPKRMVAVARPISGKVGPP
jgi:hypothetical protein